MNAVSELDNLQTQWDRCKPIYLLREYNKSNQKPLNKSHSQEILDVSKLSHDECAADFVERRRTRKRYPGACLFEFQNVMDIVLKCLLNWDNKRKESLGPRIVGDLIAWNQTIKEQGRGSLHAHWQLFTKQLSTKAWLELFHKDKVIRDTARRELVNYIDSMICASYGSEIGIIHNCSDQTFNTTFHHGIYDKEAKEVAPQNEKFFSRHPQIFRNARSKYCGPHTLWGFHQM
jgi:hypothetical protein